MVEIFLKTVPFFLLIGLGYWAARSHMFSQQAVADLTKFVFYFALSAMLFSFASSLPITDIFDLNLVLAYLAGTSVVYALATFVALVRGTGFAEAAVEAQCAVIGNVGFLALPMFVILFGPEAAGPIIMLLAVDLIVFGSLLVVILVAAQGEGDQPALKTVGRGLVRNPMVMSMCAGLFWSAFSLPIPTPAEEFITILGAAATPCALFAIGASLASKSAERASVALWLTFAKLVLHPIAVAFAALMYFDVEPFAAGVMIATAAMPVAGNVYIIAQQYNVAPARVSSAILISTILAIGTLSFVVDLVIQ